MFLDFWSLNDFLVNLDGLHNFLRIMYGFMNFLLNDSFLFDDCRLVVNMNGFEQRVCVFLLLHFDWNMNDNFSPSTTVNDSLRKFFT